MCLGDILSLKIVIKMAKPYCIKLVAQFILFNLLVIKVDRIKKKNYVNLKILNLKLMMKILKLN